MFESIKLQNINRERIAKWSLENRIYEPYSILDLIDSLSVDNIRVFNSAMLAMTMYERDMKWSVYIGDLYKEYYEDDFRQRIGFQIHSEDDAYKACILFLWMCTSPHPQVRHIILRRIVSIMKKLEIQVLYYYSLRIYILVMTHMYYIFYMLLCMVTHLYLEIKMQYQR